MIYLASTGGPLGYSLTRELPRLSELRIAMQRALIGEHFSKSVVYMRCSNSSE
jgi:hypothetical protein